MKKILIIIPAYNEEENILKTYSDLKNLNKNFDILVINDGSTDNTYNICTENKIKVINSICNLGIGGAVQTGYKYAFMNNYDIAIQFDGDGQHDGTYIDNLISPIIKDNFDMVIGSRFISDKNKFQSTFLRRVGISIIKNLIRIVTSQKITDPTSGFRAVNKILIAEFSNNYPTEYPEPDSIVKVLKNNYSVKEIPVEMNAREGGKSSINSWKTAYYMINVSISIVLSGIERVKNK